MKTPIVTLTTDWGDQGFFAGMVKGALMRLVEGVQVVDIAHGLVAYDIMTASFVVKHACMGFPEGTVHMVDVASQRPFIAVRARGQYFLCSDNGLPAIAFGDEVDEVVALPTQENGVYNFAAYNLFVPAAARLLAGEALASLGAPHPQLLQRPWPGYIQQGEDYRINVHYIDAYGNAYLGMSYREFEQLRQGRPFVLTVRSDMEVTELSPSYYRQQASNDPKKLLTLTVSATGQLELAYNMGSLARLAGLRQNSSVLLRFKN